MRRNFSAALAADARLRIIPKLSERNLAVLAWHIIPLTVVSVLFVMAGTAFRTGWLFQAEPRAGQRAPAAISACHPARNGPAGTQSVSIMLATRSRLASTAITWMAKSGFALMRSRN